MAGPSVDQLLIEVGKSEELVAVFQAVCDAEVDGAPKFMPDTCRTLARNVACRAYAPNVLELCHLINIADACTGRRGRFALFFWDSGPARPAAFRGYVRQAAGARDLAALGLDVTGEGVTATYPDGQFTVTFGRMPYLSALLEFVLTAVGYGPIEEVARRMLTEGPTRASVSDGANAISRAVYDFLREHLPTAQNQRKFHRLTGFLKETLGGDFDTAMIDDSLVLEFWLAESPRPSDDGTDFRMFQTAFRSFVRLIQSVQVAHTQAEMRTARPIGSDREAGEVDPGSLLETVEGVDERDNPLRRLGETPAEAIKFLNKRELGDLELLFEIGAEALRLPVSVVRAEVFGRAQSRLSQALRRKVTEDELATLIDDPAELDYAARIERFDELSGHLERVRLASLHALVRAKRQEAVHAMVDLRPDLDFGPVAQALRSLQPAGDNIVALGGAAVVERFVNLLEDPERVGPEIAGLLADARKAFKGIARQGFDDQAVEDEEVADGYAAGIGLLDPIAKQLEAFTARLDRLSLPAGDWVNQYDSDRGIFSAQFRILYGGQIA